jgi:hypothetical protein
MRLQMLRSIGRCYPKFELPLTLDLAHWGQEEGLAWVPKGKGVKYLGLYFKHPRAANLNIFLFNIKVKVVSWIEKKITMVKRPLVANQPHSCVTTS